MADEREIRLRRTTEGLLFAGLGAALSGDYEVVRYFDLIAAGRKTTEIRVNDSSRKKIKEGSLHVRSSAGP